MHQIDYKGVKIEECEQCNGKWFDRDELRKAKDRTDDDLRWLDFELFDDSADKYTTSPSERKCPKDSSEMTALTYMDSKVVIDKCNKCEGVFLDGKEFEKIIKSLEKLLVTTSASEYGKQTIKEFSEIFNGSENTISEIKDFMSITNFFTLRLQVESPWIMALSEKITTSWPIR